MRDAVLISVQELAAAQERPVLLDVRWALGGPAGHDDYRAGHIPGAVFVDLEAELSSHGALTDGRHPLPTVEDLQAAARRWGVRAGRPVVAYDGGGNLAASRAWWLLRWAGVPDVRLLDGALPAWVAAGEPLETGEVVPEPGDVVLASGGMPVLPFAEVGEFAKANILLDARAGERFRGETEPIDPKAGHVPGARSAPTTENLAADGRFLSEDALRARYAELGDAAVAVYCGSGVTAAHAIAALAIAGKDAALWPGSWSQWSNHDLPVATGP